MAVAPATLSLLFEQQAQKYGTRVFLRDKYKHEWRDHSWKEISDAAMRLRAGFAQMGIRAGDRIAILSENCPQWVVVDQAVLGLGAIVVPLYTTSGVEETSHVLADSGARIVAVNGDGLVRKVLALVPAIPSLEAIVTMHPDAASNPDGNPSIVAMEALNGDDPMPAIEGKRDDLATFIYTSGTTGPPKGAMLSHGNILSNCDSSLEALGLNDKDTTLSFLPVAHSFERTGGYYTVMMGGGTIAYAEGLTQIAHNLLEVEPSVVLTVPRLLEAIHSRVMRTVESSPPMKRRLFFMALSVGQKAAEYRNRGDRVPSHLAIAMSVFRRLVFSRIRALFGSRLRYLISGGAPLPSEINRFFAAAEIPIVEGYGLTEASPVVSVNLPGRARFGTVGRPVKNVEVKTTPDGELLVRGPNVMKGYFRHEAETREVIDADGWLHTGDIAEIDGDGFIRITDRKKEIIVLSGGKNVSPANLEAGLQSDPYIAQACVVGDRRKHLAAILVPNFENLADQLDKIGLAGKPADELVGAPALRSFFLARIRQFNRPLSDVEAISAFTLIAHPFTQDNGELTPTLKLRRRVVQEHYREQIESMYRD